jgi:antitoxin component of RelBE/YafQ-DinJ toxin-antitoxin module
MAKKQNINVYVDRRLAEQFRQAAQGYFGRLGMCFSAAMLMFLEADPRSQGEYLTKVFKAEVEDEVQAIVEAAKAEQHRRIAAREEGERRQPPNQPGQPRRRGHPLPGA